MVRERDFIFTMHIPLMKPFQMPSRSMTLWVWLWPLYYKNIHFRHCCRGGAFMFHKQFLCFGKFSCSYSAILSLWTSDIAWHVELDACCRFLSLHSKLNFFRDEIWYDKWEASKWSLFYFANFQMYRFGMLQNHHNLVWTERTAHQSWQPAEKRAQRGVWVM